MKKNIFIDGEVGTTGLQVHERLSQHPNVNILPVDQSKRKDPSYKKEMLEASDVAFLCLPDVGSINSLSFVSSPDFSASQIIDAPIRHFTLKLGLRDSTLAKILPVVTRFSFTNGVLPILSELSSKIVDIMFP